MKKIEKMSILISIVLISLLAISAVSAADTDDAGSLAVDNTKDIDTAAVDAPTDDVGQKESEPATADTIQKKSEPATVGASPTDAVEKSFTDLNKTINEQSSSETIYLDNHYRYDKESETDLELQSGIVLKGKHVIDGQNNMIDAAQGARIFIIDQSAEITLQNIIFKGAKTEGTSEFDETGFGGAIYSHGLLTIINCTFEDNNATYGGAIYSDNAGRLTIADSTFKANKASEEGGAIYIIEGVLKLTNSTFIDNKASYGGAVYTESQFTIDESNFTGNLADYGGALYIENEESTDDQTYTVTGSRFEENAADYCGGAIYILNDYTTTQTLTVTGSAFEDNVATTGGAIYTWGNDDLEIPIDSLVIDGCYFAENGAISWDDDAYNVYGGAIAANFISAYINASTFYGNGALALDEDEDDDEVYGGAISGLNSYIQIDNSGFASNVADVGGAIGAAESAISVSNTSFYGNLADYGGAVGTVDSDVEIDGSEFIENIVAKEGGALYLGVDSYDEYGYGLYNNISNSNFTNNSAALGGAISIATMNKADDWAIIDNCNFTENEANLAGGAVSAIGTELDVINSNFIENLVDLDEDEDDFSEFFGGDGPGLVLTISGGAISYIGSELDVEDSYFKGNSAFALADDALSTGGAINAISGNVTIASSTFIDNFAEIGGAIAAEFANLTIEDDSYFGDNEAYLYGGAVAARAANVTITESEFEDNEAELGGAFRITTVDTIVEGNDKYEFTSYAPDGETIYATGIVEVLEQNENYVKVVVEKNSVEGFEGNIYYIKPISGVIPLDAISLYENEACTEEAGIKVKIGDKLDPEEAPAPASLYIFDAYFSDNTAFNGGAIYIDENIDEANIILSDFEDNSAISDNGTAFGGAIVTYSPLNISESSFEGNTAVAVNLDGDDDAKAQGGAIATAAPIKVSEVVFDSNDIIGDEKLKGTAIFASSKAGPACELEDIELLNNAYKLRNVFYNIAVDPEEISQTRETFIDVSVLNNTKDDVTLSILVKTELLVEYLEGLDENELLPYVPVNIIFTNKETGKVYIFADVETTNLFTTDELPLGNYSVYIEFEGLDNITIYKDEYFDYAECDEEFEIEVVTNPYDIIDNLDKDYKELLDDYLELLDDYEDLVGDYGELSDKYETLNTTYFELLDDYEDLVGDYEDLLDDYLDLSDKYETLNTTYNKLNDTYNKLKEDSDKLAKELNETKAKLDTKTAENANLAGQLDEANKVLTTTQNKLTETEKTLASTQTTLTNTQNQLNNANNQATAAKNEASAKIKKIKAPSKIKKSKKLKITVTLNKKVKGKYVYVVFNGKAYKAKTNKKGIAKITIKKSALKKLGGKKFKYQVIYDQSLKNKSIKVKK